MAEKDIVEKILLDHDDVFSDVLNVVIFDGEDVVQEDALENAAVHSIYKDDGNKLHEMERDVAKYWRNGEIRLAMFGAENQSSVDELMPARAISYDGAAYRTQCLSGNKIYPVVTLILYFGVEKRWDKATSLKEMMDIPPGMEKFVNDYKAHVVELAWLPLETVKKFKSDFGIVVDVLIQKRLNAGFKASEQQMKHVDEVMKLLSVVTGDDVYVDALTQVRKERKQVSSMCNFAQYFVERGDKQGFERGDKQGFERGDKQGFERGLAQARNEDEAKYAQILIESLKDVGASFDVVVKQVKEKLSYSDEQAQKIVKEHWN